MRLERAPGGFVDGAADQPDVVAVDARRLAQDAKGLPQDRRDRHRAKPGRGSRRHFLNHSRIARQHYLKR